MNPHPLGAEPLTLAVVAYVARRRRPVELTGMARVRIARARAVVDAIVAGGAEAPAVYGVNTGFGFLADVRISPAEVRRLQVNLLRSHAPGVGPPLPTDGVRAMPPLPARAPAPGHSGGRPPTLELPLA